VSLLLEISHAFAEYIYILTLAGARGDNGDDYSAADYMSTVGGDDASSLTAGARLTIASSSLSLPIFSSRLHPHQLLQLQQQRHQATSTGDEIEQSRDKLPGRVVDDNSTHPVISQSPSVRVRVSSAW